MDGHGHEHGDGGLFAEFLDILTDPAHLLAEVAFSVLDVLIFGLLVPFVWSIARRRSRRDFEALLEARVLAEHRAIDAEHGIAPHIADGPDEAAPATEAVSQVSRS